VAAHPHGQEDHAEEVAADPPRRRREGARQEAVGPRTARAQGRPDREDAAARAAGDHVGRRAAVPRQADGVAVRDQQGRARSVRQAVLRELRAALERSNPLQAGLRAGLDDETRYELERCEPVRWPNVQKGEAGVESHRRQRIDADDEATVENNA
jgi:hypothetical protein